MLHPVAERSRRFNEGPREHAAELQIDRDSLAIVFRSAGWSYGFRTALRGAPPYVKAVVAYYPLLGPYDAVSEPYDPVKWLQQWKPLPRFSSSLRSTTPGTTRSRPGAFWTQQPART